jgi:hypothetical protein
VTKVAETTAAILGEFGVAKSSGDTTQFASDLVKKLTVRRYSGVKIIRIEFSEVSDNTDQSIPSDAKLIADPSVIQDVFGYAEPIQWSQIQEMAFRSDPTFQPYDIRWLNEMVAVINSAKRGIIRSPQCVLLFARNSELRYRFVFKSFWRTGEGEFVCEFIVCEDVSGPARGMPASLISLMTAIRMAARINHEVLGNGRGANKLDEAKIECLLEPTRTKVFNIMTEAETRGSLDPANLLQAFDDPEEKARVEAMIHAWGTITEGLGIDFDSWKESYHKSSKLTELAASAEVQTEEIANFKNAFELLYWSNIEFLAIACRRLGQLFAITDADRRKAADVIPVI